MWGIITGHVKLNLFKLVKIVIFNLAIGFMGIERRPKFCILNTIKYVKHN